MKFSYLRNIICIAATISITLTVGCSIEKPVPKEVGITKEYKELAPTNEKTDFSYRDISSKAEKTVATAKSSDELAVIDKKESYYEVILDLEKGSHYNVGKAYGEAILQIFPQYVSVAEQCLYKNTQGMFKGTKANYNFLQERLDAVIPQIPSDYVDEINGFADAIAGSEISFADDGKLSREEIFTLNLIPDILRGTQCSGMAAFGNKSQTGSTITGRILEWNFGSEKQMTSIHSVVTFKNSHKTITTIGFLGLFDVITAINDNGVFLGILDANTGEPFEATDKKCYSFEIRTALENYSTAKEVAEYSNSLSSEYTFSHNLLITDNKSAFVAENCVSGGKAGIRTFQSKLVDGLKWDNPDSLCVVNGYALEGNFDNLTSNRHNTIRWKKFNERLMKYDRVNAADVKDILTVDDPNKPGSNIYSNYTIQTIIYDALSGSLDVAFTQPTGEFPKKPVFVKVR